MDGSCMQISGYAAQCLNRAGDYRVLSRFDHVLNLTDGVNVLSIQDELLPMTPLSLVLKNAAFQAVVRELPDGALLRTGGGRLWAAGLTLDGAQDRQCLMYLDLGVLDALRPEAEHWLRMAAKMLTRSGSLLYAVWPGLAEWSGVELDGVQLRALDLLHSGEVHALVGLGGGLTPAGDDFLVGLLAALRAGGDSVSLLALIEKLQERLQGTPMLSRAFLQRAMAGEFSEPVLALLTALPQGSQKMITETVSRLCFIGHTSGCDLLGGLLYGFQAIKTKEGLF